VVGSGSDANSNPGRPVQSLAVFDEDGPGGNPPALYAGASAYSSTASIASWNGSSWSSAGSIGGIVSSLIEFDEDGPGPNSASLFAGGHLHEIEHHTVNVARWDGTNWLPVPGIASELMNVSALAVFDDAQGPTGRRFMPAVIFLGFLEAKLATA